MNTHIEVEQKPLVRLSSNWWRILRRLMNLRNGRYLIILTVQDGDIDWTEIGQGQVER